MRTTSATEPRAVRPASRTWSCCVGGTTAPSTKRGSRSHSATTVTCASTGQMVVCYPRLRPRRDGMTSRLGRRRHGSPRPASRSTGTRRPRVGTGSGLISRGRSMCSGGPRSDQPLTAHSQKRRAPQPDNEGISIDCRLGARECGTDMPRRAVTLRKCGPDHIGRARPRASERAARLSGSSKLENLVSAAPACRTTSANDAKCTLS